MKIHLQNLDHHNISWSLLFIYCSYYLPTKPNSFMPKLKL